MTTLFAKAGYKPKRLSGEVNGSTSLFIDFNVPFSTFLYLRGGLAIQAK